MTRVKVCGIARPEDAQVADRAGADAVGLIFAPSPRRVTVERAAEIDGVLSPWVARVGVFVDAALAEMERVLSRVRLDVLQLHGKESPGFVREVREAFGLRIVKAASVREAADLERLESYDVDAVLLDTYVPGQAGGTGKTFDWELALRWTDNRPLILAGGLTPDNVVDAVQRVRPYGVDVSSGVESAPGVKDHRKVKQFIARARQLEAT